MSVADEKPPIDAILRKVLDAVPFQLSVDEGVDVARRRFRDLPRREILPEVRTQDRRIPGPAGDIPIRVYRPDPDADTDEAPPPVVVFFHGGGFAMGDLDTHDGECRRHAAAAGAVVVAVDYRLAPEHPYPAAVEDAWAALTWVAGHGADLAADTSRLAVAGDSAGGNLAAVMTQRARERGGPPIVFQLLWYPVTMQDLSLPSVAENAHAPILDRAAMVGLSRWYAGELTETVPELAPGRATDFAGLPPAYIAVAGHDPLRDDGILYGELLTAAGVSVELHNAETLVHGYLGYAGVVPEATAAAERGLAALQRALREAT
ncbi:alpha/beta hydrolase [Mycolicibacterium baixiangningiae]|uniref:alpha/beta hydrolase n=1 Tax=Mycolicibacterium baixiangningiae TaxID=2761578 RepID=UPI0018D187DD|nr:alpha/beta hydrolase [Mycolicibacterium baixiangningiae]